MGFYEVLTGFGVCSFPKRVSPYAVPRRLKKRKPDAHGTGHSQKEGYDETNRRDRYNRAALGGSLRRLPRPLGTNLGPPVRSRRPQSLRLLCLIIHEFHLLSNVERKSLCSLQHLVRWYWHSVLTSHSGISFKLLGCLLQTLWRKIINDLRIVALLRDWIFRERLLVHTVEQVVEPLLAQPRFQILGHLLSVSRRWGG